MHQLPADQSTDTTARLRVLAVDDDRCLNDAIATLIRQQHDVVATTDPCEALCLWQDQVFDALVTDMDMPGMTGLELARACREHRPAATVVMVTGAALDLADVREVVDHLLRKPTGLHRILDVLATAAGR